MNYEIYENLRNPKQIRKKIFFSLYVYHISLLKETNLSHCHCPAYWIMPLFARKKKCEVSKLKNRFVGNLIIKFNNQMPIFSLRVNCQILSGQLGWFIKIKSGFMNSFIGHDFKNYLLNFSISLILLLSRCERIYVCFIQWNLQEYRLWQMKKGDLSSSLDTSASLAKRAFESRFSPCNMHSIVSSNIG